MSPTIMDMLAYLVANALDLLFILLYMTRLYGRPKSKAPLLLFGALVVLFTTFAMQPDRNYVNLLAITFMSLFLLPLFPSNLQKKVLFSLELLTISSFWGFAAYFTFTIMLGGGDEFGFVNVLLSHLVYWLLLWFAPKLNRSEQGILPGKTLALLLSIPIASVGLYACVINLAMASTLSSGAVAALGLSVSIIILFINLIVFYLFGRFSQFARASMENALLEQQITLQEEHYRQLEESQLRIRSIRHDMKNHFQAAALLAEKGDIKTLKSHLASLAEQTDKAEAVVSTGNGELDTVLNVKLSELKNSGVNVTTSIAIPDKLPLTFGQAVALFGNILDNAREACLNLPPQERWIQLNMKADARKMLFVSIKNPVAEAQLQNAEAMVSGKKDPLLHGLGLKNVRRVVEEYHGTLEAALEGREFCIRLVLYDL